MTTMQHIDPDAVPVAAGGEEEDTDSLIPEGAIKFELAAEQIEEAIRARDVQVEAVKDVEVPDQMVSDERIHELMVERRPEFVPVDDVSANPLADADAYTGVVRRRLSNGVRVNYRVSPNEPGSAVMRLVASGGRAQEGADIGPSGAGAVSVGVRAASESGTVGDWQREQVELFCVSRLINCVLESDEEFVVMDFHFPVSDGGLRGAFEVLHLFLEKPKWDPVALERAKQMFLSHYRGLNKSLERATGDRVLAAMLGPDRRFRDASPEEIEALTLEGCREAVMRQLTTDNLELNVVGDFDPEELEDCLLKFLGTLTPSGGKTER